MLGWLQKLILGGCAYEWHPADTGPFQVVCIDGAKVRGEVMRRAVHGKPGWQYRDMTPDEGQTAFEDRGL